MRDVPGVPTRSVRKIDQSTPRADRVLFCMKTLAHVAVPLFEDAVPCAHCTCDSWHLRRVCSRLLRSPRRRRVGRAAPGAAGGGGRLG